MTYSIVARDPTTGAFGVATATGGPCVGALVPHAASGVGAIATQGDTNPFYGIDGLALLASGLTAAEMVDRVTAADRGRAARQLIAIGRSGPAGSFSGASISPAAGVIIGEDFAVTGNMLAGDGVISAMARAFEAASGDLADRMLLAMLAGEVAGGDQRGTQSAALLCFSDQPYAQFDCRVDLSQTPVHDLAAILARIRSGPHAEFMATRPRRP